MPGRFRILLIGRYSRDLGARFGFFVHVNLVCFSPREVQHKIDRKLITHTHNVGRNYYFHAFLMFAAMVQSHYGPR